jgi:hypothetical protein
MTGVAVGQLIMSCTNYNATIGCPYLAPSACCRCSSCSAGCRGHLGCPAHCWGEVACRCCGGLVLQGVAHTRSQLVFCHGCSCCDVASAVWTSTVWTPVLPLRIIILAAMMVQSHLLVCCGELCQLLHVHGNLWRLGSHDGDVSIQVLPALQLLSLARPAWLDCLCWPWAGWRWDLAVTDGACELALGLLDACGHHCSTHPMSAFAGSAPC